MDAAISRIIAEKDEFKYAAKSRNNRYALLMGDGFLPTDSRYSQWRAIEVEFFKFLAGAEKHRRDILADRLADRQSSKSS